MRAIRITRVPAGEAPLEIRQAWVGCVLPVQFSRRDEGKGVLTEKPEINDWHFVPWERAVEALSAQGKAGAAEWWRTVPVRDDYLLFHRADCEETTPD